MVNLTILYRWYLKYNMKTVFLGLSPRRKLERWIFTSINPDPEFKKGSIGNSNWKELLKKYGIK